MLNQKRGRNVAIGGAFLQFGFTALMVVVWLRTDSLSALSALWLLLGGLLVWLMTMLLFYCGQLARREALEMEEIAARGGEGATIFEGEEGAVLTPAANRLAWVRRWLVPIFTLVWASFQVTFGVLMLRILAGGYEAMIVNTTTGIFLVPAGFVAFLVSRYAIGMAKVPDWRGLRAPGSYLLVNAAAMAAVALALLGAYLEYGGLDRVIAYVFPVVQIVFGVELFLNFILDIYRPRMPGQEHRLSYESRVFNLLAEPGKVGHSIAETLNYQFGFDVSSTWFYGLLQRAIVPLIIVGMLTMLAMSSIVIVNDDEQAVLTRFGKVVDPDRALLGPGIHLKWPWPIDRAEHFQVGAIHEITLGVGARREVAEVKGREVFLWTEEHGHREEKDFLMAAPSKDLDETGADQGEKTPPVNIVKLVMTVHYRIKNVYDYGFRLADAKALLKAAAEQELTRYCAGATLGRGAGEGAPGPQEGIISFGRGRAADELHKRIQRVADESKLGVEISYLGILAAHPPSEAAPAYEGVLEAERRADETRYMAQADANRILAQVAGDPIRALRLALAIRTLEELGRLADQRDNAVELAKTLREMLRRARDDRQAVENEIRRDQLLGKIRGEQGAPIQTLLAEQQAYVALLTRVKKAPAGFDYGTAIAAARASADRMFDRASGEPAKLHAQAVAYRWSKELDERARWESFQRELLVYQAAPNVFMLDRWLDVWDEVLPGMTKYVLGVDRRRLELRLNLERHRGLMQGIFDEAETK